MKTINETDALDQLIEATEQQRADELILLKEQFCVVYESLKPINLIKKAFNDISTSPEIKTGIVNNAIGLGTGFLSKKLLVGNTRNPIKKLVGTVIGFAVANLVSKYTGGVAAIGSTLLNRFIAKVSSSKEVQDGKFLSSSINDNQN